LACAPVFEKSVRNYRAKKRTAAVATLGDGAVESGTARMQGKSDTDFDANLANLRKYQVGVSPGVVSSSLPMSLAMDHPDRPLLRWLGRLCTKHRENHLAQWKGEALRSGGIDPDNFRAGDPKVKKKTTRTAAPADPKVKKKKKTTHPAKKSRLTYLESSSEDDDDDDGSSIQVLEVRALLPVASVLHARVSAGALCLDSSSEDDDDDDGSSIQVLEVRAPLASVLHARVSAGALRLDSSSEDDDDDGSSIQILEVLAPPASLLVQALATQESATITPDKPPSRQFPALPSFQFSFCEGFNLKSVDSPSDWENDDILTQAPVITDDD
jgi:hypothetical protein